MKEISIFSKEGWVVVLAVVVSLLFVVTFTNAASTISTNIDTGGTVTVTGAVGASSTAAFGGATTLYSTLSVTGASTLTGAVAAGNTLTATGALGASSSAAFGGAATFYNTLTSNSGLNTFGNATTSLLTNNGVSWLNGDVRVNGQATTTASNGNIAAQGLLTVNGTGTSTFAGALQGTYLNLTGTTATSTGANGINLSGGCFSINNTCMTVPASVYSTANTWTALQTFNGNATTSFLTNNGVSWLNGDVRVNGQATTTASNGNIATAGTLSVTGASTLTGLSTLTNGYISNASSTIVGALTATGNLVIQGAGTSTFSNGISGTFLNLTGTSATSTASNGFNISGGCFSISGTCVAASGASVSAANTWTALNIFNGSASTSQLSVQGGTAFFGGSATTTINNAGNVTVGGTLTSNNGLNTLGNATSTLHTNTGVSWLNGDVRVNGYATTTAANGNFATAGTLGVTGLSTLTAGYVSQASSTVVGNLTTTGVLSVTGAVGASSTAAFGSAVTNYGTLTQGTGGTALNVIQAGFCTIPATTISASTTGYAVCTANAGTVDNTYRLFLQATSSLPGNFVIQSASTTATAASFSVELLNTGLNGSTVTATGINSFNYWAFK